MWCVENFGYEAPTKLEVVWFKMILIYWVVVESYRFPNGVVGGSIPAVKIFSLLDGKN